MLHIITTENTLNITLPEDCDKNALGELIQAQCNDNTSFIRITDDYDKTYIISKDKVIYFTII